MTLAELRDAVDLLSRLARDHGLSDTDAARLVELTSYLNEHILDQETTAAIPTDLPNNTNSLTQDYIPEPNATPERLRRFTNSITNNGLTPFVCIQGGGAKGAWQGGALSAIVRHHKKARVSPVAAIGSSAGALNAWLLSDQITDPERNALQSFWMHFPRHAWTYAAGLLLCSLPTLVRNIIAYIALGWLGRRRFPAIFSFHAYRHIIKHAIGKPTERKLRTYLVAADVDGAYEERPGSPQASVTFEVNEASAQATFTHSGINVDVATALAASCCLPLIAPYVKERQSYMDGGIHSNLPLDVVFDHGALGGNCLLFLLNTPIHKLTPGQNYIDYRTVLLLREILDVQQKAERCRLNRCQGALSPAANLPVFIIEPKETLASNLVSGFFSQKIALRDFDAGVSAGREFVAALEAFAMGQREALDRFLLQDKKIPPLPAKPPRAPFWMRWVNLNWAKGTKGPVTRRVATVSALSRQPSSSPWGTR